MKNPITTHDVIIIGGGAAGMLAGITCAQQGKSVLILDKNERLGRKLLITGKGRCNITNNCQRDELFKNIPHNPKFLYSAFSQFTPLDAIDFFESLGVATKTERGNRVFPVSDKAVEVVDALVKTLNKYGVKTVRAKAEGLKLEDGQIKGVLCADNIIYNAKSVIIATGGRSYPLTGSTGDGYALAMQAGHTVADVSPSLVPIVTLEKWCADAMGLSLKNVTLKVIDNSKNKRIVFEELGEMLFTHFGVSGPLVLSASAHMEELESNRYSLEIDLKPALDEQTLDKRLLREIATYSNRDFSNLLGSLLPQKLIAVVVELSGINGDTKANSITREQRATLCKLLKSLPLSVKAFRPIEEAIVTRGGVSTVEIDPKTMESKLTKGLFFAGEVIDVDAYTGGFNLQIAFSTGFLAGLHA
ncbi:MAG TPA: NAD(P)/FAD-dependent oxidoreductase [Oscillospiraceae bacterium]|nr:NAD(P)/FAD-dependent oxidoreductase [Oscillospiraceae bacterium]